MKYITNNYLLVVSSKIDVSNQVGNLLDQFVEKDNVTYVYYHASNEKINLQHEKVKNETKKLKERRGKKENPKCHDVLLLLFDLKF
jgi:hypothetical protein